jgi:dTDP-4-amino-4,6-dideoxygalactose transaminase
VAVPFVDLTRHHAPLAEELRSAFERVLGSSGFILGDEVERFEAEFADYCRVRHCVGVASGTAALTIMLLAAGVGRGDEVIVPAHTFIATALALLHAGAKPVCVEVERGSGLIDPKAAEDAITPATAAILPVHLYGQTAAMDPLKNLADRHGLALLEDAAQAHGAEYCGVRAGRLGRAAAFSFYPSKNLGALGDAGAICTSDNELAERARRLRDLGRSQGERHGVAGYNERMDGIQAAALRVKLPHLDGWNEARRASANVYRSRLEGVVELLEERPGSTCVYHAFPIRVSERDALAAALRAEEIETRVHYARALPDQPPLGDLAQRETPVARDWASRELSLPIFPEMTDRELDAVAAAVVDARYRLARPVTTGFDSQNSC